MERGVPKKYELEYNIMFLIKNYPGITYSGLVSESPASTSSVWNEVCRLKKMGKIKTVDIKGKKAKGWTTC
jgi:hypothetical protein